MDIAIVRNNRSVSVLKEILIIIFSISSPSPKADRRSWFVVTLVNNLRVQPRTWQIVLRESRASEITTTGVVPEEIAEVHNRNSRSLV
jgi:hypothetical protein